MLGLLFSPAVYGLLIPDKFRLFRDKITNRSVGEEGNHLAVISAVDATKRGPVATTFSFRDFKLQINNRFACIKFSISRFFGEPSDIDVCDSSRSRNSDWGIQIVGPDRKAVIESKSRSEMCMGYPLDPPINSLLPPFSGPLKEVRCNDERYGVLFDMEPVYESTAPLDPFLLSNLASTSKSSSYYSSVSTSSFGSGSRGRFN